MPFRPSFSTTHQDAETANPLIDQMLDSSNTFSTSTTTISTSNLPGVFSLFPRTSTPQCAQNGMSPAGISSSASSIPLPVLPPDAVATNSFFQQGPAKNELTQQLQHRYPICDK